MNDNAFAIYKHKVVVNEFEDPQNWNEPFSPGKILADRLEKELIQGNSFQIISDGSISHMIPQKMSDAQMMEQSLKSLHSKPTMNKGQGKMMMEPKPSLMKKSQYPSNDYKQFLRNKRQPKSFRSEGSNANFKSQMNIEPAVYFIGDHSLNNLVQIQASPDGMMKNMDKMADDSMMMPSDPIPWPVKLGNIPEKASLYQIRGQVVKFDPGDPIMKNPVRETKRNLENAEIEVRLQLVQNKTGRVVRKESFRAFSNSGRRPFSEDIDLITSESPSHESSSMSLALSFLIKEMASFVGETISAKAIEGEIIAMKDENVLINIGRQNGVEVGDKFRVYSVGLQLEDPLTENDLGDIYEKRGIILVRETMLGFSKAVIIVGKDFLQGDLVQSVKSFNNTKQRVSSGLKHLGSDEQIPWWDFNGIKSVP